MTPSRRTPQQRDRRFARIRRLTQAILVASGVVSAVTVGYVASAAKPPVTVPIAVATTVPVATTTIAQSSDDTTQATAYTSPAPAPVTSTTVCYSTPSGNVTCH